MHRFNSDDPSMELTHRVVHPKLTDATLPKLMLPKLMLPKLMLPKLMLPKMMLPKLILVIHILDMEIIPSFTDISQKIINNPYAHKDMDVQVITQKENVCKQQYCNNQKSSALQIVECKMFLQKFHNSCIMHHASCIMHYVYDNQGRLLS
jgi:hypothetical protein